MGRHPQFPSFSLFVIIGLLYTSYTLLVESRLSPNDPSLALLSPSIAPRPAAFDPKGWANNGKRRHPGPPPPPRYQKMNFGKKIGMLFLGIAFILQICVVGFLAFKRRQILRITERYETFPS